MKRVEALESARGRGGPAVTAHTDPGLDLLTRRHRGWRRCNDPNVVTLGSDERQLRDCGSIAASLRRWIIYRRLATMRRLLRCNRTTTESGAASGLRGDHQGHSEDGK
jgi:hypothetical protein